MSAGLPTQGGLRRQGAVNRNQPILGVAAVAAAGNNQATAAELTGAVNVVSGATGTNGVRLPAATPGAVAIVYSSVAANGLPVFPAAGGSINDGTANAAVTIEGRTFAMFVSTSATNWACTFTANT